VGLQEPETTFAADVAATRRVLDKAGPCVLVGHSYGGMIITETGTHPDVKALVYVAAMQPDVGESLSDLGGKMPAAAKSIGPVGDGFLAVNPNAFRCRRSQAGRVVYGDIPSAGFQLKHLARRPQLRLGNKSRATQ
jgi:pimeloyl-ACP methyl ester carboxylesterase